MALRMPITRLTLENFRNYGRARLDIDGNFVVLTGNNGAGKTNILEAVSMLAPGRGLRRAALSDIARSDGPGDFSAAAHSGPHIFGTGIDASAPHRRLTRINGKTAATSDLSDYLAIIWLTPAMDRLFIENAAGRRNFLDRLVTALFSGHARDVARYENARRERGRLLGDDKAVDPRWIDAIESQMAEAGTELHLARTRLIAALNQQLRSDAGSVFPTPELTLSGEVFSSGAAFASALRQNRPRDRAAGRSLTGPHRSDLVIRHAEKDQPASQCSTGEQKAMLFAIVLSHAQLIADRSNAPPVLLLDEVTAHLDAHRRATLFSRLIDSGSQVWLTGTDAELFTGIGAPLCHFHVNGGRLSRL